MLVVVVVEVVVVVILVVVDVVVVGVDAVVVVVIVSQTLQASGSQMEISHRTEIGNSVYPLNWNASYSIFA